MSDLTEQTVTGDDRITSRRGLHVDAAKHAAWQRRSAIRYAAKRQARKQSARLTSRIDRRPTAGNDWTPAVRRAANLRSGGVCEVDLEQPASHLHHRKLRRFGDHRVCNALHVCEACHRRIHQRRRAAEAAGWIVPSHLDPAVVEVLVGEFRVRLTTDGEYDEVAA